LKWQDDDGTIGNGRSPHRKSRDRRSRSRDREHHDKDGKRRDRSRSRDKERKSKRSSRERSSKSRKSGSKERSEKKRSKSRERSHKRSRSKSKERRRRSKSHEKKRSGSKDRGGFRGGIGRRSPRRGPSPPPAGPRFGGRFGRSRSRSPTDLPLTPEERDSRTVFVMQLSQRVRARDIEEFFSSVGKIRDTKLIMCNKTRRFKGIAYVEFKDIESVPLALGLAGQKLLGVPVIVQPSQAEKNRVATYGAESGLSAGLGHPNASAAGMLNKGPMRLYVGSLHFNITEEMLRGIFEPFGKISMIQLIMDQDTGRSKGYGFITYGEAEDAKKALEQMNGFELAGRAMKVGHVTDRTDGTLGGMGGQGDLDSEQLDKTGIDLGATGRLALMAKLAQGTGMQLPQAANAALNSAVMQAAGNPASVRDANAAAHNAQRQAQQNLGGQAPPIATQCFMLSNMFDPATETAPGWDLEVRDDVIEEGNKHGGFLHIVVDKASPQGNVYVKCPNIATAVGAVNALHGRWFAGKVITAAYVPLVNYHNLFPDSVYSTQILMTRR